MSLAISLEVFSFHFGYVKSMNECKKSGSFQRCHDRCATYEGNFCKSFSFKVYGRNTHSLPPPRVVLHVCYKQKAQPITANCAIGIMREDYCLLEERFSAELSQPGCSCLSILLEWKRTAWAVLFLFGEWGVGVVTANFLARSWHLRSVLKGGQYQLSSDARNYHRYAKARSVLKPSSPLPPHSADRHPTAWSPRHNSSCPTSH